MSEYKFNINDEVCFKGGAKKESGIIKARSTIYIYNPPRVMYDVEWSEKRKGKKRTGTHREESLELKGGDNGE